MAVPLGDERGEVAAKGPDALRRRLVRELRRLRTAAGRTQKDVAAAMDWHPSKVIRIEAGAVAVSTNDLRVLLGHYGVTDEAVVDDLVEVARQSRRSVWSEYRDLVGQQAVTYFGYEASAAVVRQFDPLVVPDLLQTEAYARAVSRDVLGLAEREVERRWQLWRRRQLILDADDPPRTVFVIDEAVLRREVGGAETMAAQRRHLDELSARPGVTVRVVPFARGGYPGLLGAFALLELDGEDRVLYLEGRRELHDGDDSPEIEWHRAAFATLERELAAAS